MNPGGRAIYGGGVVMGAVLLVGLALAHSEQELLEGLAYDCSSKVCRLVLKFDRGHGLACYVPRLSLRADSLNGRLEFRAPSLRATQDGG